MDYSGIIKKLPIFQECSLKITPLAGGLTNLNFKVEEGGKSYVARFGFETNRYLGLERRREVFNQQIASELKIGPRIVGDFPRYNLLLAEYLEGKTLNNRIAKQPSTISLVAKDLRKLHNSPKFKGVFDPFAISRYYFSLIKQHKAWIPENAKGMLENLKGLQQRYKRMDLNCSCHLDLFAPNILLQRKKIYFLDWDYSAKSDFRFDLATFSSMSDFEPRHDKLLIKEYGRKDLDLEQLNLAKAIMLIREVGWDLVQVKFAKIKFDYKKYALDNLGRYLRIKKLLKLN